MRLELHMSEAQAELFPDWEERHLELDIPGDVQLTYDSLRDESGAVIAFFANGFWTAEHDGLQYSDIAMAADA